jgi:hypothetical protein
VRGKQRTYAVLSLMPRLQGNARPDDQAGAAGTGSR